MNYKNIHDLFKSDEIFCLAKAIAGEFENKNMFPLVEFHQYSDPNSTDPFTKDCVLLHSYIRKIVQEKFTELKQNEKNDLAISIALEFGFKDGKYNIDLMARYICIDIIQKSGRNVDEYIEHINDKSLLNYFKINTNDDMLVDLSDNRLIVRNHGVIFEDDTVIYPHQFLRRFYTSNFVGIPELLNRAKDFGYSVFVRIDPFRKTSINYYREIIECDHWHGEKFSEKILMDMRLCRKTFHWSQGLCCPSYDPRFTVFRTKMMDKAIREFTIEEYCPLNLPYKRMAYSELAKSPGVGDKICIQKFAHFCYDQNKQTVTHLDGAIRVFDINEYQSIFNKIESGQDVEEKIGKRYKMFLVEGLVDIIFAQELLNEWFRYNPHIQEYFSGINIKPTILYENLL